MIPVTWRRIAVSALVLMGAGACGAPPHPASPANSAPAPPSPQAVNGAPDSTAPAPGSGTATYRFRFAQTLPGSATFTFQDRDLSFYFRPAPDALHFQVENRQNQPVWIDWERSTFFDVTGSSGKVAHATTRWEDRLTVQQPTQIVGLQRYSDYVLPMDDLLDPGNSIDQVHRPLLYEDTRAPQYSDREFGVDLAFRIEDRPRTYQFRFRVASVIPVTR